MADHTLCYPEKPEEMYWSELYPEFFAPLTQNKSHDDAKDEKEKQTGPKWSLRHRVWLRRFVSGTVTTLPRHPDSGYGDPGKGVGLCTRQDSGPPCRSWSERSLNGESSVPCYVLSVGGLVYTITDVLELHQWMCTHFEEHPLFELVPLEELSEDPIVEHLGTSTEEWSNGAKNFPAIFRRIQDPVLQTHQYCVDPHKDAESQVWVLPSRVSQPWRKCTQIDLLEEHSYDYNQLASVRVLSDHRREILAGTPDGDGLKREVVKDKEKKEDEEDKVEEENSIDGNSIDAFALVRRTQSYG
ncbi:hypothetical protein ACRRTK_018671 [Alexandromys fortis]